MYRFAMGFVALALGAMIAGCSPAEDAAPPGPAQEEPGVSNGLDVDEGAIDVVPVEPETEAPAEPQKVTLELPEGFPKVVHIWSEIIPEEVETIDASKKQFKVTGTVPANPAWFRDNGWEEDMIMVQEVNGIVSFHTDEVLQYIEAEVGGIGSNVTITTGEY